MRETLTPVEQATLCGDGRCDVPLFDGFMLCARHTDHLSRDLAAVGDVWANLQVTIRRQDATSSAIGGGATGSRPCINLDAHDKGENLASVLSGWAGALSLDYRQRTATNAAAFLTEHIRMIVKVDWAGDLAQELAESLADCRRATDRALERIDLGYCSDECDTRILAVAGSATAACRGCGTVWSVHERQLHAIDAAWHAGAPMPVIIRTLKLFGVVVSPKDAENWVARKKLIACVHADGAKHYQLSAVRRLHVEMMAKRSPRHPFLVVAPTIVRV